MLIATVYGLPASQGSKRIVGATPGCPRMIDADPRLRSWRAQMQAEMRVDALARGIPEAGWRGAVRVDLTIVVARPRCHYRTGRYSSLLRDDAPERPASGTDVDKVLRAVLDAGSGIWWRDDRQVAVVGIERRYGAVPETTVMAYSLEGAD